MSRRTSPSLDEREGKVGKFPPFFLVLGAVFLSEAFFVSIRSGSLEYYITLHFPAALI